MQLTDSGSSQTDWSMITDVARRDERVAADAMERLVRRYWSAQRPRRPRGRRSHPGLRLRHPHQPAAV
ncbi:MAG: hypothetical protein ACYS1B_18800 [Planctomycetota bacterium]